MTSGKTLCNFKNIISIFTGIMFFSCTNSSKEVGDLFKETNTPISIAVNMKHQYKSFGLVKNRLESPLLHDFSNREKHPYSIFPKGLKITVYKNAKRDSISIRGNYAITYDKTKVSEIKGNVVVTNYTQQTTLETNQLFWDNKNMYIFTEEAFRLTSPKGTVSGFGFEAQENLEKWIAKDITGDGEIDVDD